jgi:hypothetical protein
MYGGNMNDLIKKWEPTGLLDDYDKEYLSSKELRKRRLEKTKKEILAEALEDCARKILNDENAVEKFSHIAIPLVRRIYDTSNIMERHYDETAGLVAEYEKMKDTYFEIIKQYGDTFEDFEEMGMEDAEFELCALVAESYVERYGENETK